MRKMKTRQMNVRRQETEPGNLCLEGRVEWWGDSVAMAIVQVLKQVNRMPVGPLPVANEHVGASGCTRWFVHSLAAECASPADRFEQRIFILCNSSSSDSCTQYCII